MAHPHRKLILAGNWKMHFTRADVEKFFSGLDHSSGNFTQILFPSFTLIETVARLARPLGIEVGAQNASAEKSGAFTGEISADMIKDVGASWALLGHSERRQFFGETSGGVCVRAKGLLAQNVSVMICVGETLADRQSGATQKTLEKQLIESLDDSFAAAIEDGTLTIAYEPVWAIGTGVTATTAQAEEAHQMIRAAIERRFQKRAADAVSILYGGSVKPDNTESLLSCPNVDGALVGGASLQPATWSQIIKIGSKIAA